MNKAAREFEVFFQDLVANDPYTKDELLTKLRAGPVYCFMKGDMVAKDELGLFFMESEHLVRLIVVGGKFGVVREC